MLALRGVTIEHMNDSVTFLTPQAAVDCFAETHARSSARNTITPPLLLELSRDASLIRFDRNDRSYLEELWDSPAS